MPPKRREAALLRMDAGLSYREIAVVLDSTEGSVRVLVHTAQKELRQRLADLLESSA
jgi:DNA-directed RNA polymerase specialized sigma24 family protein